MKITLNKSNPPLGGILAAEFYKSLKNPIEIVWDESSTITLPNSSKPLKFETSNDLIRILEKTFNSDCNKVTTLALNHWLTFCLILEDDMDNALHYLDKILGPSTYLIGNSISAADFAVFAILHASANYNNISKSKSYNSVLRWFNLIQAQPSVIQALKGLPSDLITNLASTTKASTRKSPEANVGRQQEGKFVELPNAEKGKVIVRFPPEASGYLHIGHAKAALLNQYYQLAFEGKLIMRFDDTNPAKENVEFEKVILEDVAMLEINPDVFTHTSQYFDLMLQYCEKLIKEGKAFVDDTPAEQMKSEREQKVDSKNRNNSVEKNLQLWQQMQSGSDIGIKCCVRAKIDMQSTNGCLRDPTIYRCKPEAHPRTGTQYKVYPTYDFACPIVDSIEGVTHVLRTMEYHDRDPQFYWFIDALGIRKPYIWEYSRLSMTNTVLSKRKLTWFVDQGLVDGWDDPRMPTVRGVLRRGMTVEGLRQFIQAQGSSRSVVFMEWDKIWAINKKVIDPVAPRYTALETDTVPVNLKTISSDSSLNVALHPKNSDVGNKTIWVSKRLLIDQADAVTLKEGENATFINYGNVLINKIHKSSDGKVTSIDGTPNLENKDYKKTLKLTWLAESPNSPPVETYCVYFDHILSKSVLGKDEDFKQYIGHKTRWEVAMVGEPELSKVRQGDIIQLQRRGFFRVDVAPAPPSAHSGKATPLILFHVPDGHTKEMPGLKPSSPAAVKQPAAAAPSGKKAKKPTQATIDAQTLNGKSLQAAVSSGGDNEMALAADVAKQGDIVRDLKTNKADKATVNAAVKKLLELKAKYKTETGKAYVPPSQPAVKDSKPKENKNAANNMINSGNDKEQALAADVAKQGDLVRDLKTKKAAKATIDVEIKKLLELKAKYQTETGKAYAPPSQATTKGPKTYEKVDSKAQIKSDPGNDKETELAAEVSKQGDLVRDLKTKKADKATIDASVKTLLELKAKYQTETGKAYAPPSQTAPKDSTKGPKTNEKVDSKAQIKSGPGKDKETELAAEVSKQGDLVRDLKTKKADKATIDAAVKTLLELKAKYQTETGKAYAPPSRTAPKDSKAQASKGSSGDNKETELAADVAKQGDIVRDLKTNKADKATIEAAVKKLLELKAKYLADTGKAYAPPSQTAVKEGKPKEKKESKVKETKPKENKPKEQSPKPVKEDSSSNVKKITRLGLEAKKDTDLPEWYSQVITKAEMIEYYDISGCYILRAWSYAIWKHIKNFLSTEFEKLGVADCYFPIFVSKAVLEREKTHIADFAPEVAWVTHSGSTELAEHIAVRPTSETVMYPAYAKWIQSYRDLPLKCNQWNNVVRWEFKQPQPFIRTREFLWQEGHTAFLTKEEADEEVLQILELYAQVYEDLLAIPVIKGRKTEKEKFAGGDYTTTVEAYVPASGRGIQGATSHHLGQNFSKMFKIIYDDPETQEKKYVYQNSWGLTTRTIGVMILVHGDDRGLVLPPRVASIQVVVVPCGITASSTPEDRQTLLESCKELVGVLVGAGIRAEGDYRDWYSPGWKFNHWELKGVPIRVELGPKDLAKGEIVAVRRLNGEKITIKRSGAATDLKDLLLKTHQQMLARATEERDSRLSQVTDWNDFTTLLEQKHVLLAPFCGEIPCEDNIKKDSARVDEDTTTEVKAPAMGAKSLCIPFKQPREISAGDKCIYPACNNKPKNFVLFGRSY